MATMRRCVNQSSGVGDQRRDKSLQAIELDILGLVSEIAWAKAMSVYPDLSIQPRSGSVDSVIDGIKIDIKATPRPDGRLLATPKKNSDPADIYVLAIVKEHVVDFVGYAWADELLHQSTLINLGHGPTHALSQSQLRPVTDMQLLDKV